ncbi:MAG: hypothetical protein RLZZ450_3697 [Pseudomonadota bacterium]|jgi:hypothetical protein
MAAPLKKCLLGVAATVAVLVGIRSADSQNVQVKTWKVGDVLTADDLNTSFMAAQRGQSALPDAGVGGADYAWSAFASGSDYATPATDGHVARFTFASPADGFVSATALFSLRVKNSFETVKGDCSYESLLATTPGFLGCPPQPGGSCALPGYTQGWVNGNLPTYNGAGTYLSFQGIAATLLPVVRGDNTFYLNGRSNCLDVLWGNLSVTSVFVRAVLPAAIATP